MFEKKQLFGKNCSGTDECQRRKTKLLLRLCFHSHFCITYVVNNLIQPH